MNQTNATPASRVENPVFDNGNDAAKRINDPTVAVVVTVNLFIKRAQRTMSCNAPLHEVPLLRRMYAALGGIVTPNPAWVPGIKRRAKLSHGQLQDELKRLSEKYVIPTEGGKRDIMAEVYGSTGADRLRGLRDKMKLAESLWRDIEAKAMTEIRASGLAYHKLEAESLIADRINPKDMDQLCRALDPAEVAADEISLAAIESADLEHAGAGEVVDRNRVTEADEPRRAPTMAETFGADDDGNPASELVDDPADLTEADVLIANLRQDGIEASMANRVALIACASAGSERTDALKEAGLKGKDLTTVQKRLRAYDTVAAPLPAKT